MFQVILSVHLADGSCRYYGYTLYDSRKTPGGESVFGGIFRLPHHTYNIKIVINNDNSPNN